MYKTLEIVVINRRRGFFDFPEDVKKDFGSIRDFCRHDPRLVEKVKELNLCDFRIVKVALHDDFDWAIDDSQLQETVKYFPKWEKWL